MTSDLNKFDSTDKRWDLLVLRQEMRELKREQKHLISKSHERALTIWELSRIDELLDEIMGLMRQFGSINVGPISSKPKSDSNRASA